MLGPRYGRSSETIISFHGVGPNAGKRGISWQLEGFRLNIFRSIAEALPDKGAQSRPYPFLVIKTTLVSRRWVQRHQFEVEARRRLQTKRHKVRLSSRINKRGFKKIAVMG